MEKQIQSKGRQSENEYELVWDSSSNDGDDEENIETKSHEIKSSGGS